MGIDAGLAWADVASVLLAGYPSPDWPVRWIKADLLRRQSVAMPQCPDST